MEFIFALCMSLSIPNCEQAFFECVERSRADRFIYGDPEERCEEVMQTVLLQQAARLDCRGQR